MRRGSVQGDGRHGAGRRGGAASRCAPLLVLCILTSCGSKAPSTTAAQTTAAQTTAAQTTERPTDGPSATEPTETSTVGSPSSSVAARAPSTLRVPGDAPTVQAAVDKTVPGDLVLVDAGTYAESVTIRTPGIVVRGVDRNAVVLDGRDADENGFIVAADGVAVENLTVKRYTVNGLLFTKAYDSPDPATPKILRGYRASYITAYDNGLYGIYAFFARGGVIEHSYASGHPDSGIYIGQCRPCDAVVHDVIAERNAVGYEGTNAGGNLVVVRSFWRRNRVGMTPNSQDQERLAPQSDVVIAGNVVEDNNDPTAPSTAQGAQGFGIAIGGGTNDRVLRNLVRNNASAGIAVTDLNGYEPSNNEVRGNVLSDNGVDLAYFDTAGSAMLPPRGNCFAGNTFVSSQPSDIERLLPCAPKATGDVTTGALASAPPAPNVDYRTVAAPPPQPTMPHASTAPPVAASATPPRVDIDAISVPKAP